MITRSLGLAAALVLALAIEVTPANASAVNNVHVTSVVPNNAGILQFFVDTTRPGAPACATGTPTAWTISTNTIAGQTLASLLFTALVSNLPIDIGGIGSCDQMSNVETAGYIAIHK